MAVPRFVCFAAILLVLVTACKSGRAPAVIGGASPTQNGTAAPAVTPPPRPTAVPQAAQPIAQTTRLGSIQRRANQPPQGVETRKLSDASCSDGVMTLQTSRERIYAVLPCDRFWNQQAKDAFAGQQVAIVLEVTDRFRILLETLAGAQAEFTVEGIWVTGP